MSTVLTDSRASGKLRGRVEGKRERDSESDLSRSPSGEDLSSGRGQGKAEEGPIMDMSEDCWEHVGLLQEVSAEPPPPPPAPDFLIQQPEVSDLFLMMSDRVLRRN